MFHRPLPVPICVYLRSSAACGAGGLAKADSFVFLRSFAACRAVGFAQADPFAVCFVFAAGFSLKGLYNLGCSHLTGDKKWLR